MNEVAGILVRDIKGATGKGFFYGNVKKGTLLVINMRFLPVFEQK